MKTTQLLPLLTLWFAFTPLAKAHQEMTQTLASEPCFAQVTQTVRDWNPSGHWKKGKNEAEFISSSLGEKTTIKIGKDRDGHLFAHNEQDRNSVTVTWNSQSCEAQISSKVSKSSRSVAGASAIAKYAANGLGRIYYAWSPRMPYSVMGIKTIREVADRLGLPITFILDPDFPVTDAKLKNVPPEAMNSVPFPHVEMRNHYPSVLVSSSSGKMSSVLPGLESRHVYEAFIKRHLK